MRELEHPGLARPFPCFDAEEFGLDPRRRHGGAIDGDEGVAGTARAGMDHARHDLLAGTGRAVTKMRLLVGATFSIAWRTC